MSWLRTGDKPLSEAMLTQLFDTYLRHEGDMSLLAEHPAWTYSKIPPYQYRSCCMNENFVAKFGKNKSRRSCLTSFCIPTCISNLFEGIIYLQHDKCLCISYSNTGCQTGDCIAWMNQVNWLSLYFSNVLWVPNTIVNITIWLLYIRVVIMIGIYDEIPLT